MSTKYKISQENEGKTIIYGNYPGKTMEEAIHKAYRKQSRYLPFDFSRPFHVQRGKEEQDVKVDE